MSLPIDDVLPALAEALQTHDAVVLQAPPGAGKTTRVPLALLDAPWLAGQRILMLEPRRLAARAAATFMARQCGETAGHTVGYRTRLDTRIGPSTRIEVVTEGVLTRMLQQDPMLDGYGVLIFDEFHERSLQADLGLALAREAQQALRPTLRLLVMSATLDGERIAALLDQAPIIISAGRQYPVTLRYSAPGRTPWLDHAAREIRQLLGTDSGSVLVFLPGAGEIRALQARLEEGLPEDVQLRPLAGTLSQADQDAAIAPPPPGQRKLVLTTAIAETSLTIEGVRTVVDCGWSRRPHYDPGSGLTRLLTERVSAAAATQRAGRAGRLSAGQCLRLWPESERLAAFAPAEINHADLTDLALELAAWGATDPATLIWLDPPPQAALARAVALLRALGALDAQGRMTRHGQALQGVPLPARLGHLLLTGQAQGHGRQAAELAALLSERDLFSGALARQQGADLLRRWQALHGAAPAGVSRAALDRVRALARRLAKGQTETAPPTEALVGEWLARAWPDRVAQRRGQGGRFLLSNGRGAWLPEEDPLAAADYLVAVELDGEAREARIFLAVAVSEAALREACADALVRRAQVAWDARQGLVRAETVEQLGALVLRRMPLPQPEPAAVAEALLTGIREAGLAVLPWTPDLRQWQARVLLLRRELGDAWPDVSDAALAAALEGWCGPFLPGITRLKQLADLPLAQALMALLDHKARQQLEALAPTHLSVPSGSRIALDYLPTLQADGVPVLAVKLQEMFGQQQTPTVASGRVPVTLHLLSPARRPVAVTADLVSFWQQGYPQVRRDLRGRYPKHPWPEDPLSAAPQRGVRGKA
ncbi:ATP-dependent helicase HrpB [Isoalcanivorax indicus]|uniref:ATP-dependent helicase HrpB n=1 Tax=Isoalcanivorax indicus TaxID=2202653 RepID=UPI000DBA0B74|nr:ATP-dependent helicase HrpB [Isoalcanivorax indicus]